jgi:cyanophycinase
VSGPLALVGGDELNPGNEPQDELLAQAAGDGPAFVLATAATRHRPELAVEHARAWFSRFGLEVSELPARTRTQMKDQRIVKTATGGRFFYLVGGDPGITVDLLTGSPVWEAIVGAWRGGAALAGSSAGAMAMGSWSLIKGRFKGDVERRFKNALSLVPNVAVVPHFETFGHRWVASARSARPDAIMIGIDERTAAVWHQDAWRVMGPGTVTVVSPEETTTTFQPGRTIEGLPAPG